MMVFTPEIPKSEKLILLKQPSSSSDLFEAEIEIPEGPENRVPTDTKFLTGFKVMLLVLLPFLIYTLCYSNNNNYDHCGNICGKKNVKYDQWECTGKDYTNNKFLQFDDVVTLPDILLTPRQCVSQCSIGYQEIEGVCFKEESGMIRGSTEVENLLLTLHTSIKDAAIFLQSMAWRLTIACFFSLGVALTILYLFRVATAVMVWSMLQGTLISLGILVIILWSMNGIGRIVPLVLTVTLLILLVMMIYFQKKISLVIAIFQEAMKVTFAIPRLLLVPVLVFFAELLLAILFFTALTYMLTAGTLTEIANGILDYQSNIVMRFTMVLSFWMTFWISQFLIGIQYMVVASAVSKWYFAKDKENLIAPISTSASIAFKFHLGSIAFGSLIITVIAIIRSLLTFLLKNRILKAFCNSFLSVIEEFLNYLSKNAYIMTAMHGKPFFKSGKRAAKMLLQSVSNIVVLNYIASFIIGMAHVVVMLISLLFTFLILQGVDSEHVWAVYVVVAIVSLIVAAICFSIFEVLIDTIYLCFCEDKLLNNGIDRPYAMSRDLMDFMENSKKIVGVNKTYIEL